MASSHPRVGAECSDGSGVRRPFSQVSVPRSLACPNLRWPTVTAVCRRIAAATTPIRLPRRASLRAAVRRAPEPALETAATARTGPALHIAAQIPSTPFAALHMGHSARLIRTSRAPAPVEVVSVVAIPTSVTPVVRRLRAVRLTQRRFAACPRRRRCTSAIPQYRGRTRLGRGSEQGSTLGAGTLGG
jgi:hypothetical protein